MIITLLVYLHCTGLGALSNAAYLLAFTCNNVTYMLVCIFSNEVFPTPIRSISLGVLATSGSLGSMAAPLIVEPMVTAIHPTIHPSIHTPIHSSVHPTINSFIHLSIHSFIHPKIQLTFL